MATPLSDDKKEKLILEAAAQPAGGIKAWLEAHGFKSNGSFYAMRERYLRDHPAFRKANAAALAPRRTWAAANQKPSGAAKVPTVSLDQPLGFKAATKEEKIRLIAEHDALPSAEQRVAWRQEHQVSGGLLSYHRTHNAVKAKRAAKAKPAPATLPDQPIGALVAEYNSLSNFGGEKAAWLKLHNLNHQQIFEMRRRVAKATVKAAAKAATNGVQRAPNPIPPPQPQFVQAVPHDPPTLADAIAAFEVRQDIINGFIEDLRRMYRGSR